jgi:non-ribosomal peptide synthetase-like protein
MVTCSVLQTLIGLVSIVFTAFVARLGLAWIDAAAGFIETYLRSMLFAAGSLVTMLAMPILAKWVLIGRWRPQRIRVWSLGYLRFWLVKSLIRTSPMSIFVGSPLYALYLRALGARIGRRVLILSPRVPVCTDLLSVGDGTVIRRDTTFSGYRARAQMIETGRVSIGCNAFVGEHTVLDLNTSVGDGAQLGHASALLEGQSVPDGERWHGSPARRTQVDYRRLPEVECGRLRRIAYSTYQVVSLVGVTAPLMLSLVAWLLTRPEFTALAERGPAQLIGLGFYAQALIISFVVYFGGLVTAVALALTLPRLLNWFITPGRTYPLYGVHHAVLRAVHGLTNNKFLMLLTGDSSYVVGYLRALGYRMPDIEQTGSNFGSDLHHETPFLIEIGRGTQVSDGVSLINADYSATQVRTVPLSVGQDNFLGNAIAYPADGRTGRNCLIATKAMVPVDGPVREHMGLLGSPCFEIPRTAGDNQFDHLTTGDELRRRLTAKNRHNLTTMTLFLLVRWFHLALTLLLAMAFATLYRWQDAVPAVTGLTATMLSLLVLGLAYFITVERSILRFGSLQPKYCSIYDPYFWLHERYWKMEAPLINAFNGTPFKSVLLRLVGVKVGKRVFDDGCAFTERMLATVGDDCTLNAESTVQCHSMEDSIFKSDHTVIGAGTTLGVGALVHYGVTIGEGAAVLPDTFVMKGEALPDGARWGGNPARPM